MDQNVQAITQETLTPLVRNALADATAELTTWQVNVMHGGWGSAIGGTALYRVAGNTRHSGPWSLVLKILYERPGESEDTPYYWKREYEVYRSGMLDHLPETGLMPPSVYGFVEYPASCWIWMADIQDAKQNWSLEDYTIASRRLGRFNGAYLNGLPVPDYAWLNDNWHCRIIPPLAGTFGKLDEYLQNPLIQITLPVEEKERILAIWQEADRFCDALARLPQTLCHLDAFPRNLLHREVDTILIDWALAGRGAVGEELTAMVALPLYFRENLSQAEVLDKAVFNGYIAGLRDMGWTGDEELVRLGYTCAMALRGLAGVKQDIGILLDENKHPELQHEQIEDVASLYAEVRRYRLLTMSDEARQLLALLR